MKKPENLAKDIENLMSVNKSIAAERSPNSIPVEYEKDNKKMHDGLKKLYDFLAQTYGYQTFDHMIAVAHSIILAKAIAQPEIVFLPGGANIIKAIEQAQANIRPKPDPAEKKLPRGESKTDITQRMVEHFSGVTKEKPPS